MKPRIKIANNITPASDDYHIGTITDMRFGEGRKQEKNGRDIEEIVYQRCELTTVFDGTDKPITIHTYTGVTVNAEPLEVLYSGRGKGQAVNVYNRFTTLLLSLGLIGVDDLAGMTNESADLLADNIEKMKGKKIRAKVEKDKGGFYVLDITSITLMNEGAV
jgi:hypothetical protein